MSELMDKCLNMRKDSVLTTSQKLSHRSATLNVSVPPILHAYSNDEGPAPRSTCKPKSRKGCKITSLKVVWVRPILKKVFFFSKSSYKILTLPIAGVLNRYVDARV